MHALSAPHFHDETKAREYLESLRWPNGPICPHCGSVKTPYKLEGKSHRPGLWKCVGCHEQFTVTVGTVFERSKIPLSKWLTATYLLCSSKKGMSSHQLHRTLGITYKTAWFMTHRIREAMKDGSGTLLGGPGTSGIVEADETYLGKTTGQGKGPHLSKKEKVVALVEREGRVRAFHVPSVTVNTLKPILEGQIAQSARVMTDEAQHYKKAAESFANHEKVNHGVKEYVRGDVTTNSVEGYFGILKRGLSGTYQHVSPAHLKRYVEEFSFRYNNRVALGIEDAQRAANALKQIEGKRLTYRRIGA
ncbi:MAG TPA: IS1595 family transposase [Burkholderiaceae bacterium]|nr:IS1595 family transposase [Burkholderiaceae bacterium]